ncbi:MAG: chloride channel protein [Desulfuromonadaceae bacterium]|nr:chloride channel protein [Desulfuromonadaceae bacterium]
MSGEAIAQRIVRGRLVIQLLAAVVIGFVSGLLAVAFRFLLLQGTEVIWGAPYNLVAAAQGLPAYAVVSIPVGAGLFLGLILYPRAPETRGAGVADVIEAMVERGGDIHHRTTFYKMLATLVSLSCGASVGREGPMVHIGASIGSAVARLLRVAQEWKIVFLACGAAGAIAATFNAPMAGMLFAAEIILIDFQVGYLSQIAVSAITATVVSHQFLGDLPTFDVPSVSLVHYWEIPVFLLLGLLAGALSIVLIKLISRVEDSFNAGKVPLQFRPAVGGFILGAVALWCPHVLGVGYFTINQALGTELIPALIVTILIAKFIATACCVGSGFSGGIIAPSLFLGALIGSLCGLGVQILAPGQVDPTSATLYAMVGMAAMFSGTTLAPITAMFTIFELTYNFEIILPLMVGCIASLTVVQTGYGISIYETSLVRKGVSIVRGRDVNLLRSLKVASYMESDFESISQSLPLKQVVTMAQESEYPHFVVHDKDKLMVGMLSMHDLKNCLGEMGELAYLVLASEIMTRDVITITPDDNLEKAFELFQGKNISTLPVVSVYSPRRVKGVLKKSELIRAYSRNVLRFDVQ